MVNLNSIFQADITSHKAPAGQGAAAWPKENPHLPEVAFIGRSNVGKSSLINALLSRKNFAQTSRTPGATRALHFYKIGENFTLVDLPGYGFAKLSGAQAKALSNTVQQFIATRQTLKCVYVLVDARHGLKESDEGMLLALQHENVNAQIIFTKTDATKAKELSKNLEKTNARLSELGIPQAQILQVSSEKKQNIDNVRTHILEVCGVTE